MQKSTISAAVVAILFLAAAGAHAQASPPLKVGPTAKGEALLDGAGMTLYVFDKDMAGKSACNGACAQNWPPLLVTGGVEVTGDYSIVTREDGSRQWAFKGRPLYRWVKDQKPGDATGDGLLGGAWHIAAPR